MKVLFSRCDGLVLPQLNDMEVPTHIVDGQTEDMAIEMANPFMEGEVASMFQVEGVQKISPL